MFRAYDQAVRDAAPSWRTEVSLSDLEVEGVLMGARTISQMSLLVKVYLGDMTEPFTRPTG